MKSLATLAILALVINLGCSSKTPPPQTYEGLTRVANITEGEAWSKPGDTLATYDKFIIDPVQYSIPDYDPKTASISPEQLHELGKYFDKVLRSALSDGYQIVDKPGPGTLRLSPIITEAAPSYPVMNAVSSVLPIGIALSLTREAVTGQGSFVGQTAVEIDFYDSLTGELIGVYKGHKSGKKYDLSGFSKTGIEKEDFEEWAQQLRDRVDLMHNPKG